MKIDEVKKIGVLGCGLMGSGIVQVCATMGYQVTGRDVNEDVLKRAMKNIIDGRYGLKRGLERSKLTKEQYDSAINNIKFTTSMEELAEDADVIIECVPENITLKMNIFKELDKLCPEKTILSTNTSGLSVTVLGSVTNRPDRVVGMHFFNPSPVMKLVEVVKADATSDETTNCIADLSKKVGKTPIIIKDSIRWYGFVDNRAFGALRRECQAIVNEEIATMEQVDTALKLGYGFPMGPFELGGLTSGRTKR